MKQCVPVVSEEYDGELRFSIIESELTPSACILTLGAKDGEDLIGFKIEIPAIVKRLGFKFFQLLYQGILQAGNALHTGPPFYCLYNVGILYTNLFYNIIIMCCLQDPKSERKKRSMFPYFSLK